MVKKYALRFLLGVILLVVFTPIISFFLSIVVAVLYVAIIIVAVTAITTLIIYSMYIFTHRS